MFYLNLTSLTKMMADAIPYFVTIDAFFFFAFCFALCAFLYIFNFL